MVRKIFLYCALITMLIGCSEESNSRGDVNPEKNQEEVVELSSVHDEFQGIEIVEVHFINTGQSDSVLIKVRDKSMLIDAGDTSNDNVVDQYLIEQGITELEYFIISHFHADHIGSANIIESNYNVKTTLVPNGKAETRAYKEFILALAEKELYASVPLEGSLFEIGTASFQVFNTRGGNKDTNDDSLVIFFTNGKDKMIFTGDATSNVEKELKVENASLMKIGHHGSKTSSSKEFLDMLQPKIAVLSVGKNNRYGHPDSEVMQEFEKRSIPVYRTDEEGHLVFISSGDGITTNNKVGTYSSGFVESEKEAISKKDELKQEIKDKAVDIKNSILNIFGKDSKGQEFDFSNCDELREIFPDGVSNGHQAYKEKLDRDKDGWACEVN